MLPCEQLPSESDIRRSIACHLRELRLLRAIERAMARYRRESRGSEKTVLSLDQIEGRKND